MNINLTKSKLYGFTIGLAVMGLLAMPAGGFQVLKGGSDHLPTTEEETDWTLAVKDGVHEEEVDWTLAKNETDWTLASRDLSTEEEVDWTLAKNETEEDETDWTLASRDRSTEEEVDWTLA